jgi:murein L,D-transpeptidase YafK
MGLLSLKISWKPLVFMFVVVVLVVVWLQLGNRKKPCPRGVCVERILIEKKARRLTLLHGQQRIACYSVSLGRHPVGKKAQEGDGRTPEGLYTIDRRKLRSSYHRALHISYPNHEDRVQARSRGVSPGGDIMIHGLPNGMGHFGKAHLARDWTDGCIAVTDEEIEEIWKLVEDGTKVEIVP